MLIGGIIIMRCEMAFKSSIMDEIKQEEMKACNTSGEGVLFKIIFAVVGAFVLVYVKAFLCWYAWKTFVLPQVDYSVGYWVFFGAMVIVSAFRASKEVDMLGYKAQREDPLLALHLTYKKMKSNYTAAVLTFMFLYLTSLFV